MGNHTTNINSPIFSKTKDYFLVSSANEESKVGTAGYEGYIGYSNRKKNYTFIKKFNRLATNNYPDDNCAIECYTCDSFVEIETLGPLMDFMAGVSYYFQQVASLNILHFFLGLRKL
jgi:hypothetical protein